MVGSLVRRAALLLGTVIVGGGATLFGLMLPATSAASSTFGGAALVPGPPPVFGLRQARADRPDPATPPFSAPLGASLPAGVWQPLGPAPIGPPFLAGGNFYAGPNSGRITGLVTIPLVGSNVPRVVAATAGGGVWTSDNLGSSWSARSDSAADLAIGSVAADPTNPNHLIAGTGEANQSGDSYPGAGILVSSNGGATWTLQNPGGVFTGTHIAQVAIDPSNANHQFAATDGGLYVTSNGGVTWAKPTSSTYTALDGRVTAVVINPANPKLVYFAGDLGGGTHTVARSTDGGLTWAHADTGIAAPGTAQAPLVELAIAKSLPSTLYASVGSLTHPVALYVSGNSGSSWIKKTATPDYTGQAYSYGSGSAEQGWYDNVIAVDPTNPKHVLAGGIALVETNNGGASWTNVNGGNFNSGSNRLHPDHHALSFAADGSVWIGDDGGVYHYTPTSNTVADANGNLNITQFYFGFNVVGSTLLAGTQDNASARTSSSALAPWTGIWSGDGGPSAITGNHTALQFIQADSSLYETTDAFVSTLTDITPPQVTPGADTPFTPPDLVLTNSTTPASPTVFYGGQDLYRTTNPTAATPVWTKVTSVGSGCPSGNCVSALAASPTGTYVYVGFRDGTIEVSANRGVTFTKLKGQSLTETWVTGLSVNPANPKAITATFSYSDTRSAPGLPHVSQYVWSAAAATGTWTTITGSGLPAAVSRVVYDGTSLVAATDKAIYGTDKPAGSATVWKLVGTGLPNVQVQDLFVAASGNAPGLYAVTHGRGAWRLPPG